MQSRADQFVQMITLVVMLLLATALLSIGVSLYAKPLGSKIGILNVVHVGEHYGCSSKDRTKINRAWHDPD